MLKTNMYYLPSSISNYSILKGVSSPDTICTIAKTMGYRSIALTDQNNLYGLPAFLRSCKEYDLEPVIGAEITSADGSALIYAQGQKGFANLCRIISEKQCRKNFTIKQSVVSDSEGIHLVSDNTELLKALHEKCVIYYCIQSLRRPPTIIKKMGIKSCVIPSMAFRNSQDFTIHKILRAIDCNTTLQRLPDTELLNSNAVFRPWNEVEEEFGVFDDALSVTAGLMQSLSNTVTFGVLSMPHFDCGAESSINLLRKKTADGACKRYGNLSDTVIKRMNYELDLIERKGFADYFLVVDDIVKQSPRTCGRGSGAASIVAYSLGITNVDPIRYNLMFERFLNPGRIDPPDLDIDFAWDERDGVLDYVFKKYGESHAAMVATHLTCGARMAIREVARIYGLTEDEISKVTKKIPYFLDMPEYAESLEEVLKVWPAMNTVSFDHPWSSILKDAGSIIGLPRGIGTHCGGVVITSVPIRMLAPIQYSAKGYPIIQWEKDGAEEMGLVKIDLLGNRSLAVIRDAIANVKDEDPTFDERGWDPQTDTATIDLLAKGKSMGVFYVESPAMRLLQRKTRSGSFEHLVIHSSIIRPAANKFIQKYVERLHGKPYTVLHPSLTDTLSETFGIMVYQEDVSRVAIALAGFSVEDADMLRKVMSKKAKGRTFQDYKKKLYDGAMGRGVSVEVIDSIWEMMLSFSGYSFCKPHSASYVQVSFQSAYLKAHYPAAFMAAVLSNYGGYYITQAYISEAMRLGLIVVPPDINVSNMHYFASENNIYVGLCQIKGLTDKAIKNTIMERNKNGLYVSIDDFLNRALIDESNAEKLLLAGACDLLDKNANRSQLFWQMRRFYRTGADGPVPQLQPLTKLQFLQNQYAILGFLTVCHPIAVSNSNMRKKTIKASTIPLHIGKLISVAGWCVTSKTVSTKFGENMQFVTFEDETDIFETVFFPEVYKRFAHMMNWQAGFIVSGMVIAEFGVEVVEVHKLEKL
jgi:DNA polymerase-3 subunit alpha/error-prone DNA polymerase